MRAVVLDTETTGLTMPDRAPIHKHPYIIELYMADVDLKDGKVLRQIDLLFKVPFSLEEKTTKITGLTNEMIAGANTFDQHIQKVLNFIEKAPCVIAHNASFDRYMIDTEVKRHTADGEGVNKKWYKVKWPKLICTVESSVHLKGKRLTLGALHELLFGAKFEGAHRAKADVQALIRCCVEMNKRGML